MVDEYETVAELYDYVVPYASRGDVAFFVAEAAASEGPVLEVGSGTGRVLIPTARAGIDITGLDASDAMLRRCKARLESEPGAVRQRVTLVRADMRAFDLGTQFSLVTVPFRPFQHLLTVDDQLACLAMIRRHLRPGGRLILDLFNPSIEYLVNRPIGVIMPEGPPVDLPDGRQLERHFMIVAQDRFAQVNDVQLIYRVTHPDGTVRESVHAFRMRYLFRYEAEHLLARGGFEVEHLYAGYDRTPYGSTYPGELIFVARKS